MKIGIAAGLAFAVVFGLAASPGWAAAKPTHAHAGAGKAAPSCAALAFRPAGGTRLAAAQSVPATAGNCATLKKMPMPQAAADSCTGDRFTLVVSHADDKRYALLYAATGSSSWKFCSAGTF
jgi:hypothetical protein